MLYRRAKFLHLTPLLCWDLRIVWYANLAGVVQFFGMLVFMPEYTSAPSREYVPGRPAEQRPRAFEPNFITDILLPMTSAKGYQAGGPALSDLAKDAAFMAAAGLVGKGVQTGVRAATLNPGARELYLNSLLGRLYHGSKSGVPQTLVNRGPQPQNWFNADLFLTTSKPVARGYMGGPKDLYRATVPYDVAKNLNVMDLYKDVDRALGLAGSPRATEQLAEAGANVVKHQSGHGAALGGLSTPINKPVYALTEPAGIQMSRVRNTGYYTPAEQLKMFGGRVQRQFQSILDQLLKRGAYDPENVL